MTSPIVEPSLLKGKNITYIGDFARWPMFYEESPQERAKIAGAIIVDTITEALDYLIIGAKGKKGKAEAIRKVVKLMCIKCNSDKTLDNKYTCTNRRYN